jgi:DNA polymerase V
MNTLPNLQKEPDNFIDPGLFTNNINAGFPSPAEDYEDRKLDLNEHLVKNNAATFFVRVSGDSMTGAGIFPGDLLIVDRSAEPKDRDVVIGYLDGEFTVKRLCFKGKELYLTPDNPKYKPVKVLSDSDFNVWGVVTFVIHRIKGLG